MHELGITEEILESVLQEAEQAQAERVSAVYLVNGPFSGVADEAVRFYWPTVTRQTLCEGSILHFVAEPGEALCLDCEETFEATDYDLLCPICGGGRVQLIAGNRLRLESIEVD